MDERFVVDTPTLAEILSVSDRRIQQLAADGVLPRLQDPATGKEIVGRWYAPACVREFVKFKVATSKGSKDAEEIDQQLKAEKLRRAKAEADLREDLRDRERAKLFHADDVMTVLSDCMSQIKAKVLALPSRLTLPLLGQKDPSLVNELLTESVAELLNQLRTYTPEDFRSPDLPELLEQNEQAEQEEASE
jgi:phage terminase Nu1 subunit (DNA packaging protein)